MDRKKTDRRDGEQRTGRKGTSTRGSKPERRSDKPASRSSRTDNRDDRPAPRGGRFEERGERPAARSSRTDNRTDRPAPRGGSRFDDRGDKPERNSRTDNRSDRPAPRGGRFEDRGERPATRTSRTDNRGDRPAPRGGRFEDRGERPATRSSRTDSRGDRPAPRGGSRFDERSEKPERKSFEKRPERRTKSDKITPHKPGAFDKFDKRFAKPNPKEEARKEKREAREVRAESYETRNSRPVSRSPRTESREDKTAVRKSKPDFDDVRNDKSLSKKSPTSYDRKKSPDDEIRLNRFIANSGVCSRRKADELIEKGEVTVNGEVVRELGYKVKYSDKVKYGGKLLKPGKLVYVLLNKPKDYITTMDDPMERRTVIELTAKATDERIYPVGRLDRNTTGLLLLTNDGDLAEKLAHPRNQVKKIYEVELDKSLSAKDFEKIREGIELEDGPAKVDQISYLDGKSKKFLGVEIHIGRNRIVRRIFEALGYEVVRLDRVIYAGLSKKDLPRGRYRHLTKEEIIYLKHLNKY